MLPSPPNTTSTCRSRPPEGRPPEGRLSSTRPRLLGTAYAVRPAVARRWAPRLAASGLLLVGLSGCDDLMPGARRESDQAVYDLGTSPGADAGEPEDPCIDGLARFACRPDAGVLLDLEISPPRVPCGGFDPDLGLVPAPSRLCDPNETPGHVSWYDNPAAINAFRTCGASGDPERVVYIGFSLPSALVNEVRQTGGDHLAVRVEDFAADIDVVVQAVGGDPALACELRPMWTRRFESGEAGVLGWIYPRHSDERGLFAWFSLVYTDHLGELLSVTGEVREL